MSDLPTFWDDAQDAELRLRWREGLSASQIAALPFFAAYGRSRNSIIGRVHRLGISGSAPHKTNAPAAKSYTPKVWKEKAGKAPAPKPKRVLTAENAPKVINDNWFCQWIDDTDDLGCAKKCGLPRIHLHGRDQSWCAAHYARVFIGKPVEKPRRRHEPRLQSAHFW
jgi:hypothetical protein